MTQKKNAFCWLYPKDCIAGWHTSKSQTSFAATWPPADFLFSSATPSCKLQNNKRKYLDLHILWVFSGNDDRNNFKASSCAKTTKPYSRLTLNIPNCNLKNKNKTHVRDNYVELHEVQGASVFQAVNQERFSYILALQRSSCRFFVHSAPWCALPFLFFLASVQCRVAE